MNDLTVFDRDGQLYTDSRQVAKMIGKDHKHLLRDIDGYVEVMEKSGEPKIGVSEFFVHSTYKVEGNNKTYPCYNITKKGCEFVANKLTGRAFHRQEQQYYHVHLGPARYVWVLFFARFQEDNQAPLRDSWLSSVAFLFWERFCPFSSRLKCFVEPQFLWILGRE